MANAARAQLSARGLPPYGGTPKPGAIELLRDGATNVTGLAWPVAQGRVVFLGPIYLDDFASYMNQGLTDGTNPQAREILLRSIEWAGRKLN